MPSKKENLARGGGGEHEEVVYHEKQSRQLCALHSLNNLFQGPVFTKSDLDEIANNLSPNSTILLNPHKSSLGLGNYDVNVMIVALEKKNFEAIWFNKNKDPCQLDLGLIFGFILNIPNRNVLWYNLVTMFATSRRHWITVRRINTLFYNLDSKLKEPELIGDDAHLVSYLQKQLNNAETEIFVIVDKEIAKTPNKWLRESSTTTTTGENSSNNKQS